MHRQFPGGVWYAKRRRKEVGRARSYEEMTKEEVIKKEKSKFARICRGMGPEKRKAAETLVAEAAFMGASLYELRQIINRKGYTEQYQNGANQKGVKKCSEVEVYNTMIKNYAAAVKQITDLADKGKKQESDGVGDFLMFLEGRGKGGTQK